MKAARAELLLLAAVLASILATSFILGSPDDEPEGQPDPSTYNAKGSGSLGLYLWLRGLGLRVERWEQPLVDLPGRREASVVLLLGPHAMRPEEAEVTALLQYVRQGGVLILADSSLGGPVPGVMAGPPVRGVGLRPVLGERPGDLRPAYPSPYAENVDHISPAGIVRFRRESEGWAPLFADAGGDVVDVRRMGAGRIIAIADPGLFSNARLEAAGHA
ncbi:MAG TPA: DUF4350 domain-containing protein, partial [Candidatus Sulfotelmatobacter sp.]|nr:DUF4350 domain-containing protein [Candidatus Sulfotelmatobacter sp.]